MPKLARIAIHPIKSFDPQSVDSIETLPTGALAYDRRWALFDRHGDPVNGKRFPAIHRLRSHVDLATHRLQLQVDPGPASSAAPPREFSLDEDRAALEAWCSDYFEQPVTLAENSAGGFPDDLEFPGPTLVSTATLVAVSGWFSGITLEAARARFRANLEIGDTEPFWEDALLDAALAGVRFRVGSFELLGMNPCARCPVPARDPWTGVVTPAFARKFAEARRETLPGWAPAERFDHFYRLAVNTSPTGSQPQTIRVGDRVEIVKALPGSGAL